jgi:hypothetical protein
MQRGIGHTGSGAAAVDRDDTPAAAGASRRVSEGTRTPDRLDHNQELYQLSYAHQDGQKG